MNVAGDRDELGQKCIAGQRVDQCGPTTRNQVEEVVKEALMRGAGDRWNVADFYKNSSDINRGRKMYEEIIHYTEGFFQILPTNRCKFHYGLYNFNGIEYGKRYVPYLTNYEGEVSYRMNTALRHHAGKVGKKPGYGLKCDDAGWVLLESVLDYHYIWDTKGPRYSEQLYRYEPATQHMVIDPEIANSRMKILFKIMHHCVAHGRRVRVQVLAFGINPGANIADAYLRRRGVTADTEIPEEGLIIEPIAVRTPSGHTAPTDHDEVRLKMEALSHKLTPGAVTMMPSSFHVTSRENLMGIFEDGLIPGGGTGRSLTFFSAFAPWDRRSWEVSKGTYSQGEKAVFYIPTQTLMEEYDGRINDSGQPVTSMTIPFTSLRGGWVQDADMKWHRLIVPSGHEQLIRSVYRPWRCAGRDEDLKEARWCAESVGSPQKLRRSSTL